MPQEKLFKNLLQVVKKSLVLTLLFAILKIKPVPIFLMRVEAALDPGNVERFAQYLHHYTHQTQVVVTHRPTENADMLYGVCARTRCITNGCPMMHQWRMQQARNLQT